MVYGFLRQSHGHIDVESEVGKGTTFNLYLPATPVDVVVESPNAHDGVIHSGIGTVLIVEDHDLVRDHAREQFESLGYDVITAENGSEAIDVLNRLGSVDLMFTDVVMPGEISGFDLGKIVSERWSEIKILYTSGYNQDSSNNTREDILPKPYSLEALSRKVKEAMGEV
jgi:CheY-like chemotaxis protein